MTQTAPSAASDEMKGRLIRAHLRCFVPLAIAETWLRGGVSTADFKRAEEISLLLGTHGDAILFFDESRKAKKGGFNTEAMFEKLVDGISILAFCPGGITTFSCHFDAEEVRQGWGIAGLLTPSDEASSQHRPPIDLACVLPIMRAISRLEMRWFGQSLDQLETLLPFAVLDQVCTWWASGGPTEEATSLVTAALPDLEQRGDDLFTFKRGESQRRFVQVANALALLSFLPAGVTSFGMSFNAEDIVEKGLGAFHRSGRDMAPAPITGGGAGEAI